VGSAKRLCCESRPVGARLRGVRAGLQRHSAAKDQRIISSLSASAEERYREFPHVYPSIVGRVPQLMLASYLA